MVHPDNNYDREHRFARTTRTASTGRYRGFTDKQWHDLKAAIGKYAASPENENGVRFQFDAFNPLPYWILNSQIRDGFGSFEELLQAAIEWRRVFDSR